MITLSEKLVSQAGPGPVVPIVGQGASRNEASVTVTRLQAVSHPLLLLLACLTDSPSSQVPCTARQHAGLGFRGCGATSQTKGSRVALYFMPLSFFVRTGRRGCRKRKRQKYNSREKAGELSSDGGGRGKVREMKWLRGRTGKGRGPESEGGGWWP